MVSACMGECFVAGRRGAMLAIWRFQHVNIDNCVSVPCEDTLQNDPIFMHGVWRILDKATWRTVWVNLLAGLLEGDREAWLTCKCHNLCHAITQFSLQQV
jgi:hypothetical protein